MLGYIRCVFLAGDYCATVSASLKLFERGRWKYHFFMIFCLKGERMNRADEVLNFWLGHIEETLLPTENRQKIWFSVSPEIDEEIKNKFEEDLNKAIQGVYTAWEEGPRGSLALIILFDQFSRKIYRDTPKAFAQDQKALDLVLRGVEREYDHSLSLIERAFYYMPFMHSEAFEMQSTSVRAYKILVDLSFPEARSIFERFLDVAIQNFEIIKNFGRFPGRNQILNRKSTQQEIEYLKTVSDQSKSK